MSETVTIEMEEAAGLSFMGSHGSAETLDAAAAAAGIFGGDTNLYVPPPSHPWTPWSLPYTFAYEEALYVLDAQGYEEFALGPGYEQSTYHAPYGNQIGQRRDSGGAWNDFVAVLPHALRVKYSDPSRYSAVSVRMGFSADTSLTAEQAVDVYGGLYPANVMRSIALDADRSAWFGGSIPRWYITPINGVDYDEGLLVPFPTPEYAPLALRSQPIIHDDNVSYSVALDKVVWDWEVTAWEKVTSPVKAIFPEVGGGDGPYFHFGFAERHVAIDDVWYDETLSNFDAWVRIIAVPIDTPPLPALAVRGYSQGSR